MWILRELWSDITGSTLVGLIGITGIFLFLFAIIAVAIYRVREIQEREHAGVGDKTHSHDHDWEKQDRGAGKPVVQSERKEDQLSHMTSVT
jgi:hypothetical protein